MTKARSQGSFGPLTNYLTSLGWLAGELTDSLPGKHVDGPTASERTKPDALVASQTASRRVSGQRRFH